MQKQGFSRAVIQRHAKSTVFILENRLENSCYNTGCAEIEADKELDCRRDFLVKGMRFHRLINRKQINANVCFSWLVECMVC